MSILESIADHLHKTSSNESTFSNRSLIVSAISLISLSPSFNIEEMRNKMRISLSRRYFETARKQWNTNSFRGISAASGSLRSDKPRIWSESLSFASPESDFLYSPEKINASNDSASDEPVWSGMMSFASPESDFVSASKTEHIIEYTTERTQSWSGSLSFASPESDFVSAPKTVHLSKTPRTNRWSESLSFASPESDFVSAPKSLHVATSTDDESTTINDSILQKLFETNHLYSSPETATGFIAYTEMIDDKILKAVRERQSLKQTLPKTMNDALNDKRPIVITTAESPFQVVDVNSAWESLCGYRRDEAIGRNLGSLLQGPDTNMKSANKLVHSLKENGFSETLITNYTKNGRRFENHIQIGVIPPAAEGDISSSSNDAFFVGVLHDISESNNKKVTTM